MNRTFTIIGSRLYSPQMKDVAGLADAHFISNFHTFIYKYFFSANQLNSQSNEWKIRKISRASIRCTNNRFEHCHHLTRTIPFVFVKLYKFWIPLIGIRNRKQWRILIVQMRRLYKSPLYKSPITFLWNVTEPLHESEVQIDLLHTLGLFLIYYIFVDKNFFPQATSTQPNLDKCMEN